MARTKAVKKARAKASPKKTTAKKTAKAPAKPAPKPTRAGKVLLSNADLEAAIVADPYVDHAWSVLEDWLLEQNDPRSPIIVAERAKDEKAVVAARKKLSRELFGEQSVKISNRIRYSEQWRAGFLVETGFSKPIQHDLSEELALVETMLATPAARLLRKFSFSIKEVSDRAKVTTVIDMLKRAPCAATLRELGIGYGDSYKTYRYELDGSVFDGLTLHRLELWSTFALKFAPSLASLRSLKLDLPSSGGADLAALFRGNVFPELRELDIPIDELFTPSFGLGHEKRFAPEHLAPLLLGTATPKLETLLAHDPYNECTEELVAAIAPSKLLKQLKTLKLGYRLGQSYPEDRKERVVPGSALGPTFAHLETLTVPDKFKLPS